MAEDKPRLVPEKVTSDDLSMIYANGFKAGLSSGDVFVVLSRNGTDFAVLNLSFTVAKSLGAALIGLIEMLEKGSKQPIMTTQDAGLALKSVEEKQPT